MQNGGKWKLDPSPPRPVDEEEQDEGDMLPVVLVFLDREHLTIQEAHERALLFHISLLSERCDE